jgi:hypothetical protein
MPAGVHTGKSIVEPIRSQVIVALASGESPHSIGERLGISDMTVAAVRDSEWDEVMKRKPLLAAQAERTALLAGEQLAEAIQARAVPLNLLIPVYGVSVDKALALRGEPALTVNVNHSHTVNLVERFNDAIKSINDSTKLIELPDVSYSGQTDSVSPSAHDQKKGSRRVVARKKSQATE